MKVNVGSADRAVRIIVGILIMGAGIYLNNWWGLIGLVIMLTGLLKRCPAYTVMKLDTLTKK